MDLARFRFQLAEKDQGNYERGEEWFVFDINEIDATVPTLDVIALEKTLGLSLDQLVGGLYEGATRGKLLAFWLARKFAGITEDLEFFTPQVRAATVRYDVGDDADPPVPSASADEPLTS